MAQQRAIQLNQQNLEAGYRNDHQRQQEEIPLNRLNSTEENAARLRMRSIFNAVIYLLISEIFYHFII